MVVPSPVARPSPRRQRNSTPTAAASSRRISTPNAILLALSLSLAFSLGWLAATVRLQHRQGLLGDADAVAASVVDRYVRTSHRRRRDENEHAETRSGSGAVWRSVSIEEFGARGDNATDCTDAIREAVRAVSGELSGRQQMAGGEVVVPEGGVYQTGPFNLTSHVVLRVEGTLFGVPDNTKFPPIPPHPSYGRDPDFQGRARYHPLVFAVDATNVTITGSGTIDGGGWYWYPFFAEKTKNVSVVRRDTIGRPHILEVLNCTGVEVTGVLLKDPAFWTVHLHESKDVYMHHMRIEAPFCQHYKCPNTDGIDVDSCENVLIEHNYISVGDDHVTCVAGRRKKKAKICRNVTVQHNTLGKGMGLTIGSGTAGGVQDVLYYNNVMTTQTRMGTSHGIHIKTRAAFGGFVRNVAWVDNVFHVAGRPGGVISIQAGYQSGHSECFEGECTEIRDVVIRNATIHVGNAGGINCLEEKPCVNITLDNVRFDDPNAKLWGCSNIVEGSARNVSPPSLLDNCPQFRLG